MELCRALNTHAWHIVGPIVVLKGDDRRITLHCERCNTWRSDVWSKRGGAILTRYYRHNPEYKGFIHEHNNAEARATLLGTLKETTRETNRTGMRSLPGAQKKGRRGNVESVKRPRDKRRVAGPVRQAP